MSNRIEYKKGPAIKIEEIERKLGEAETMTELHRERYVKELKELSGRRMLFRGHVLEVYGESGDYAVLCELENTSTMAVLSYERLSWFPELFEKGELIGGYGQLQEIEISPKLVVKLLVGTQFDLRENEEPTEPIKTDEKA